MSERAEYPPGVPCWVENLQDDVDAARSFYARVFGWEFSEPGPAGGDLGGRYFVARLRGADVAGVARAPVGVAPAWMTHVCVGSAADAARRARSAGGEVLAGPLDVAPAGRLAVLADPTGAVLCAFEPRGRRGAQRVNEPGAWAMSALLTFDPDGAAGFLHAVFGWEAERFGPISLLRLPGFVGGEPEQPVPRDVVAGLVPVAADETPRWQADFWVADVEAAVDAATSSAGRVLVAVHDAPPFRRAILADPGGASFSVSQLVR